MNTTTQLHHAGQSIWYDNIQRSLITNGELAGMIGRGEIRGVTSNPTIFMNAITKSHDYDAGLLPLIGKGMSAEELFVHLAIEDIQMAADLFLPLYTESNGGDGYVSLEVSPTLAHDTQGTVVEAIRLWGLVNRPNLMVKIPATLAGIPAITAVIAEGINVNVTLIFSRQRYATVMDAYMKGLEIRVLRGLPIDRIASVASFFVSRVDSMIDPRLNGLIKSGTDAQVLLCKAALGKAAIANARLAYADFLQIFATERFSKLRQQGARLQRPLWASTGTKNPNYRDVMYIEELVGADTVNTVPPATLTAFIQHGQVRTSIGENLDAAKQLMVDLTSLGIVMDEVTRLLEEEGVKSFMDSYGVLLKAVESRK